MPNDLFPPTLDEQIAEARREVELRRRNYPRWIEQGRLRKERAERQIATMEAVVETLEGLK